MALHERPDDGDGDRRRLGDRRVDARHHYRLASDHQHDGHGEGLIWDTIGALASATILVLWSLGNHSLTRRPGAALADKPFTSF